MCCVTVSISYSLMCCVTVSISYSLMCCVTVSISTVVFASKRSAPAGIP